MRHLKEKMSVTDLNNTGAFCTFSGHELRPLCSFAISRPCAPTGPQPHVNRYEPAPGVRAFRFPAAPACMVFAQMTSQDGLRDIATGGPRQEKSNITRH